MAIRPVPQIPVHRRWVTRRNSDGALRIDPPQRIVHNISVEIRTGFEADGIFAEPAAEIGIVSPILHKHEARRLVYWFSRRTAYRLCQSGRPSWQTFLRAPGAIAGADFFTTEVWTWRGLVTYYTLFVIDVASRRVDIVGSTPAEIGQERRTPGWKNGRRRRVEQSVPPTTFGRAD